MGREESRCRRCGSPQVLADDDATSPRTSRAVDGSRAATAPRGRGGTLQHLAAPDRHSRDDLALSEYSGRIANRSNAVALVYVVRDYLRDRVRWRRNSDD